MLVALAILLILTVIGIKIFKIQYENAAKERNRNINFPVPNSINRGLLILAVTFFIFGIFNNVFFYAEPGYVYHVRTILGQERVVDGTGYAIKLFGRVNAWKKAMTVIADTDTIDGVDAEETGSGASASLPPQNITFLDQVDGDVMAVVRFRIPVDPETFLIMAHEYRTPENLIRVALIPAFQETIQATGSLMSAEDYFSGGRTEFLNEFENQMQRGIYMVKRMEISARSATIQKSEADASDPLKQEDYDDQSKTIFIVEKQLDSTGQPMRKVQKFTLYGINVHEARVTAMKPNTSFVERMKLKQKASADRAIAREQRIQEEEQKYLAVAKGERQVAERQAAMKVEQIDATTKAETEKKTVLIEAERQRMQAKIQKDTSKILLVKAKIDADAVKVAADAEAYKKRKIMLADNALAQKLEAEIMIQKVWADAYARRKVPTNVFGGGAGGAPTGNDTEVSNFMKLMTLDAAKRLNYDRGLNVVQK